MDSSRPGPPHQLVIGSEQTLVAESVGVALQTRGHVVTTLLWPTTPRRPARRGSRRVAARPPPVRPEVGLLISELDSPSRIRAARTVLLEVPVGWMVMTTAVQGPAWGAVLEAGARLVVPSSLSLEEIDAGLRRVATGEPMTDPALRAALVAEWRRRRRELETLAEHLDSLTPREREVLQLLHAGTTVGEIAVARQVAASTVRSQVRAVLRKLGVSSQLAAVSLLDVVVDDDPVSAAVVPAVDPAVGPGPGRRRTRV